MLSEFYIINCFWYLLSKEENEGHENEVYQIQNYKE